MFLQKNQAVMFFIFLCLKQQDLHIICALYFETIAEMQNSTPAFVFEVFELYS